MFVSLFYTYRIVEMQNLTLKFKWGYLCTNALRYGCTSFKLCCCLLYFLILGFIWLNDIVFCCYSIVELLTICFLLLLLFLLLWRALIQSRVLLPRPQGLHTKSIKQCVQHAACCIVKAGWTWHAFPLRRSLGRVRGETGIFKAWW